MVRVSQRFVAARALLAELSDMPTHVLVLDANVAFATMIQQALEDHGGYKVVVAGTAAEAVGLAAQLPLNLAIVDMGLPDVSGDDAIRGLRATLPGLPVVAIPVGDDAPDLSDEDLQLQGILSKPFFLPDLQGVVEAALGRTTGDAATVMEEAAPTEPGEPAEVEPARAPEPETAAWLADAEEATRRVADSVRQSQAVAGLMMQGGRLVAYHGRFSEEDFEKLAEFLRAHWAGGQRASQSALMRFVRLASSNAEHLLYATAATGGLVLALVFKAEAPVTTVRKRSRDAVAALGRPLAPAQPAPPPPASRPASPKAGSRLPVPATKEVQTATIAEWTTGVPASASPVMVDAGLQLPVDKSLTGLARTPHALYNLTYAIVWAPKFPKTRLVGNIAGNLAEWIRHIALSYDWRVDRVEVRPECVIVVVNCPPEIAPERVITTLKRTTSERVFVEFPNIAADHPGGDFWAPGYLLHGAGQMLSPQQINDFLAFTRREQGLKR